MSYLKSATAAIFRLAVLVSILMLCFPLPLSAAAVAPPDMTADDADGVSSHERHRNVPSDDDEEDEAEGPGGNDDDDDHHRSLPDADVTDRTAPVVSARIEPPANALGWHRQDVTVRFRCRDRQSGIRRCPKTMIVRSEGAGQRIVRSAYDRAGNRADISLQLNIDKTPPRFVAQLPLRTVEATGALTSVVLPAPSVSDNLDPAVVVRVDRPGPFPVGRSLLTWEAADQAGNRSQRQQWLRVLDRTPPLLTVPADKSVVVSQFPATVPLGQATATDLFPPVTIVNDAPALFPVGMTVVNWLATDAYGNRARGQQQISVRLNHGPQLITRTLPHAISGRRYDYRVQANDPDAGDILNYMLVSGPAGMIIDARTGRLQWLPDGQAGTRPVTIAVSDDYGLSARRSFTLLVEAAMSDPVALAPPLSTIDRTDLLTATAFLYSGPGAIQSGVPAQTIAAERVAVLRGQLLQRDGLALPGVRITVKGHPEFGETRSRSDGLFDLVVNGGSVLTINFSKPGFLPVQRQIDVPWRDYVWSPDVVMIPYDQTSSRIDLAGVPTMQVAQGTRQSGRRATLLFPAGVQATLTMPDGSRQPITALTVRATEYTIGDNGPLAMPGELPSASGYTYAVELSVDEALAAGARSVSFSRPLPVYVENFLGFQVGTPVPAGYYDADSSSWMAAADGRVVRILAIDSLGRADLDVDGHGMAADPARLQALGISADERHRLAALYRPGQTLWRVPVEHFTAWDFNMPFGLPPAAVAPDLSGLDSESKSQLDDPQIQCHASSIECQNQVLRERQELVGSPWPLHYSSARVRGNQRAFTLDIPIIGTTIPADLYQVRLQVDIAGQHFVRAFGANDGAPLTYRFIWDGRDAYGRLVQGRQRARVTLTYVYLARYYRSRDAVVSSFARFGDTRIDIQGGGGGGGGNGQQQTACTDRNITLYDGGSRLLSCGRLTTVAATSRRFRWLGLYDIRGSGLAGWTLAGHHRYDPVARILYRGDGRYRRAESLTPVIATIVGTGVSGYSGDGGPARDAQTGRVDGLAVSADGSVYFSDADNQRIRRIQPDGRVDTVVSGVRARDLEWSSAGRLYFVDRADNTVKRLEADGSLSILAGGGSGQALDGVAADTTAITPYGIALARDGSIYIANGGDGSVLRVATDGTIERIVTGTQMVVGTMPARSAYLFFAFDVALDSQERLYVSDRNHHRVYRIDNAGLISLYAGGGNTVRLRDGVPATDSILCLPEGLAIDGEDTLYIADSCHHRVRQVSADGLIRTIAGDGSRADAGDLGPATAASLAQPGAIAIGREGQLYIADVFNFRVRIVQPQQAGIAAGEIVIVDESGSESHVFDLAGRHLRTLHTLTGATLQTFTYDAAGWLVAVRDGDGNTLTIARDPSGLPMSITGHDGQQTLLTVDAAGYLQSVTDPAGGVTSFQYGNEGLLTVRRDGNGGQSLIEYDTQGRLLADRNPAGFRWRLQRSPIAAGYQVDKVSTLGRRTRYRVEQLADGGQRRTTTTPDGLQQSVMIDTAGARVSRHRDGSLSETRLASDPRFGLQAPVTRLRRMTLPSGLQATVGHQRQVIYGSALESLVDQVTTNGRTLRQQYDLATRHWTITLPSGRRLGRDIDSQGRLLAVTVPGLAPTKLSYDARGRLQSLARGAGPDARVTTFDYGGNGHLVGMTDALGRYYRFSHDVLGRLLSQQFPDGRQIDFRYDALGNRLSIAPPGRAEHRFQYTADNLVDTYRAPGTTTTATPLQTFIHDRDRRLTAVDYPGGRSLGFTYDAAGRMIRQSDSGAVAAYDYDPQNGNLSAINGLAVIDLALSWDGPLLQQESWSGEISGTVGRRYDNDFRVRQWLLNGNAIDLRYDPDGLLVQAGAATLVRDSGHGGLILLTLDGLETRYGYNRFAELTSLATNAFYQEDYRRDALGRIVSRTERLAGQTTVYDYHYDLSGRLAAVDVDGVPSSRYDHDPNGNRIAGFDGAGVISARYDGQDRLLQYNDIQYRYDEAGNRQSRIQAGKTTSYRYDLRGNLHQVALPDGRNIVYLIDGRHRRVGKKVDGVLQKGFLYQDALNPVAELDGNGRVVSRFVYGSRSNTPDYMIKNGQHYRILSDHLGSPRLIIDTTTGAVIQRMDYDAYGRVIRDSNPGFQPFGFAGGLYDPDTGLTRFGSRDYDAETGRWTSKDPIGFAGGDTNLYGYVLGDPVNFIDEEGKCGPACAIVAGAIVGGFSSGITTFIETGDITAGLESLASGSLGGAVAVLSFMAAPQTFFGTFAAIIFDTAITAAGNLSAVTSIVDMNTINRKGCRQ